jgi:hypothetical protein
MVGPLDPSDERDPQVISADTSTQIRCHLSVQQTQQIAAWLDHLTDEEVLERMSRLQMTHTYDPDIVMRNFEILKGMRDDAVAFGAGEATGD